MQYASTLDEAIEMVLNTPRTFGMNIVISDSKIPDAVVLEVDANRYAIRRAQDGVLLRPTSLTRSIWDSFRVRAGSLLPVVKHGSMSSFRTMQGTLV